MPTRHYLEAPPRARRDWHFTYLSGKLKGVVSFSVACTDSPFCRQNRIRATEGDVCSHCYAHKALTTFRSSMLSALESNRRKLWETYEIPKKWPKNESGILRFMSHGDVSSREEAENCYRLARDAPSLWLLGFWTKNAGAIRRSRVLKPSRMRMIYSSFSIDKEEAIPDGFDAVFTVYSRVDRISEGVFHCKGSCGLCRECYVPGGAARIGIALHR
jgi:hypothetical protein